MGIHYQFGVPQAPTRRPIYILEDVSPPPIGIDACFLGKIFEFQLELQTSQVSHQLKSSKWTQLDSEIDQIGRSTRSKSAQVESIDESV